MTDPGQNTGPVLLLGAGGLLGGAIQEVFGAAGRELIGLTRAELDITDEVGCRAAMADHRPSAVINCAAYTKVDQAEDEEESATRVNGRGAGIVAGAAAEVGAKVVYFSTDFVFDGTKSEPYTENDPPVPINAYGRSKWAGENATRQANPDHLILRTAWLFGPHGPNFVKTIVRFGREKDELNVVDDQQGSPTCTLDLAAALVKILGLDLKGTYHLVNAGVTSWFGLAQKALEAAGLSPKLMPMTSDRLDRKAIRPTYSVLSCDRLARLGVTMRPWPEALENCFNHGGPA